jgi:hypothetical protein
MLSTIKWNVYIFGPVLFCTTIRHLETSEMLYPTSLSQSVNFYLLELSAEGCCCACAHSMTPPPPPPKPPPPHHHNQNTR